MSEQLELEPRRRVLAIAGRVSVVAVVGLFVALLAYGLVTKAPQTGIDDSLARAEAVPAPGFALAVLQRGSLPSANRAAFGDGRLALDELRGTPVVLNFWASWCVPCREEAPLLERSWRTQRRGGALFLGLNMQDLTDDARAFMREFRISFPNVRDPSNRVAHKWGVTGLPETFFISREGRVVGHVIGVVSPAQLQAGIAAAQAGRPDAARQGGDRRETR